MANLQATTLAKETGTTELHHEASALGLTPPAWVALAMLCVIGIMVWHAAHSRLSRNPRVRMNLRRRCPASRNMPHPGASGY